MEPDRPGNEIGSPAGRSRPSADIAPPRADPDFRFRRRTAGHPRRPDTGPMTVYPPFFAHCEWRPMRRATHSQEAP